MSSVYRLVVVKTFIGFSGIDKIYGRAGRAHCILLGIWWEPSLAFTAKLCLGWTLPEPVLDITLAWSPAPVLTWRRTDTANFKYNLIAPIGIGASWS